MASATEAAVLYDNGSFITNPEQGYGGADASVITSGLNSYGFSMNSAAPFRLADDFTVPDGQTWNISSVRIYGYQTGSGVTPTFTGLNLQIWNGRPGNEGTSVVWGNLTDNVLGGAAFTGVYRVLSSDLTSTARPVMELTGDASLSLPAGDYWLEWAAAGSVASGPWNPPLANGQLDTGNARQYSSGAWNDVLDGSSQQGLPFQIQGEVAGAPESGQKTMMALALLSLGAMARWQKSRQPARP